MRHWLCDIIMLILGCDVYKCVKKEIGTKEFADLIKNARQSEVTTVEGHYSLLFEKFKKANNLTDDVIDTYINI